MLNIILIICVITRSVFATKSTQFDLQNSPEAPLLLYINRTKITFFHDESLIVVYAVKTVIEEVLESLGLWVDLTFDYHDADVFINFKEDVDFASTHPFAWSVWPALQEEFCFVYAASKKLTIFESMSKSENDTDGLYLYMPIAITSMYHVLILRFKLKATWFDSLTRGPLYAIQMHTANAMPHFNRYPHYKYMH